MRDKPQPYSDKSPRLADIGLRSEIARLTAISIRQSESLAQALFEKNEALRKLAEAEKMASNARYYAGRAQELSDENTRLESIIGKARIAVNVLRSL